MPSRNASYGLFSAMAFRSDGKKTLDLTLPEISSKYPIGIVAGADLICVAGASRVDGAMIFRAYGRSDGKLRWQKDDILSAAAHVSKDNNKDYFDHVPLADKPGNVFLGWTQPKDNEYQIVLAKFSPQGEVL